MPAGSRLAAAAEAAVGDAPVATLLHEGIASAVRRTSRCRAGRGWTGGCPRNPRMRPTPSLLVTTVADLPAAPDSMLVECFGPFCAARRVRRRGATAGVGAGLLHGELHDGHPGRTAGRDCPARLLPRARRPAAAGCWNQWPTGADLAGWAQQHGGLYPSTTAPASTSMGTSAIGRFLSPCCPSGFPDALLPAELAEANPLGVPRRVDGVATA